MANKQEPPVDDSNFIEYAGSDIDSPMIIETTAGNCHCRAKSPIGELTEGGRLDVPDECPPSPPCRDPPEEAIVESPPEEVGGGECPPCPPCPPCPGAEVTPPNEPVVEEAAVTPEEPAEPAAVEEEQVVVVVVDDDYDEDLTVPRAPCPEPLYPICKPVEAPPCHDLICPQDD